MARRRRQHECLAHEIAVRAARRRQPRTAVYYNPGVGTQFGSRLRGGMFGYGLDQVVIDAYEWLIDHYEDGDEIFIFGFSRGAYSARSLAGLVAKCGLLRPGAPLGVKQIYARYRLGSAAR